MNSEWRSCRLHCQLHQLLLLIQLLHSLILHLLVIQVKTKNSFSLQCILLSFFNFQCFLQNNHTILIEASDASAHSFFQALLNWLLLVFPYQYLTWQQNCLIFPYSISQPHLLLKKKQYQSRMMTTPLFSAMVIPIYVSITTCYLLLLNLIKNNLFLFRYHEWKQEEVSSICFNLFSLSCCFWDWGNNNTFLCIRINIEPLLL